MQDTISLSEAAKYAGKSNATLRRWAKDRLINAEKDSDGKWRIKPDDLKVYLATHEALTSPSASDPNAHSDRQGALTKPSMDYVRLLEKDLERERAINDDLRKSLADKDAEIVKLIAELKAEISGGILKGISKWVRSK